LPQIGCSDRDGIGPHDLRDTPGASIIHAPGQPLEIANLIPDNIKEGGEPGIANTLNVATKTPR
jgi:hypothetical protein